MSTPSYKKRRKASVIALSPQFNEAIRTIRSDLGLPSKGLDSLEKRGEWYMAHYKEHATMPYEPLPRYYWHFPKEFVELIKSFGYSPEASKVNYYPDVPLDRHAMELIRKFGLPEDVIDQVKAYVLGEKGSLSVSSGLQPMLIALEKGTEYLVLVGGLDASSTKKDWIDVWAKIENVLRLSGTRRIPNKRTMDSLFLRDLHFWKQIKEGKPAHKVADDWIEEHPTDKGYPVEDMIRKAVKRIDEVMNSNS